MHTSRLDALETQAYRTVVDLLDREVVEPHAGHVRLGPARMGQSSAASKAAVGGQVLYRFVRDNLETSG